MIVGLGHPRSGTRFTADLISQSGIEVGHEKIRAAGIVSWQIASLRPQVPWGDAVTEFTPNDKLFLVARSPLSALKSVANEGDQIRSIGFRASVILENFGLDLFAESEQLKAEPTYDYMTWAILSLTKWYQLCLSRNPKVIFQVDKAESDSVLSDFLDIPVSRENKVVERNYKYYRLDNYDLGKIEDQPKHRLAEFAEVCDQLGYPDDAKLLNQLALAAKF